MVFSSVPVFQVPDPPNWQYQPTAAGGSVSDNNNDDGKYPHLTLPPMPPSSHGLSIGTRLTKLPQQETPHKCPRCASTNTKFCYYNNYSLAQPRHFCKACRRYWTRGGALRNVPVGGGFRRNKKSKKIRSKSPPVLTGNISSTSGVSVSSTSCTTNNILGHATPSVNLPHFPLFSSINFTTDLRAEEINSLCFRGIQSPTSMTGDEYRTTEQWRLQNFPVAAGVLEPSLAGEMYQFRSGGLGEATSQYGLGEASVELIKFEEDQGFMSLPKNENREINWSSVNGWNIEPIL